MKTFFYKGMEREFDAIVIGGSWGGMDALVKITKYIPKEFPLPLIVVLHRLKETESDLINILKKNLKMNVGEITDKQNILPGHLYVAPQNYHVLMEKDRTISLCVSEPENFSRPSIDILFQSAARVFKEKLVSILLTGANEDGSKGIKTISESGGFTIIQDPDDAESPYMPKNALKLIHPDYVLSRKEITDFLLNLI